MESIETVSSITSVESCMDYLRDMSMYKMMNDPNHRAMLFVMELLMDQGVPILLSQLAERVFHTNVGHDIQGICGYDCTNLKTFLSKYPSLFKVDGDMVSAVDVDDDTNPDSQSSSNVGGCTKSEDSFNNNNNNNSNNNNNNNNSSNETNIGGSSNNNNNNNNNNVNSLSSSGVRLRKQPDRRIDLATETEAVKYFQTKISSRWQERWMPIRSLAGHLSQAPDNVRTAVGPQSQFRTFLDRHPHVFEVQGDLVGLRDQFPSICLRRRQERPRSMLITSNVRPLNNNNNNNNINNTTNNSSNTFSKVNSRRGSQGNSNSISNLTKNASRPTSMILLENDHSFDTDSLNNSSSISNITLSSKEFQAAMYLRSVICRRPAQKMGLNHLFMYLAQAPASIRDCVGWTRIELEEFIRKMPALFDLDRKSVVHSKNQTEDVTVTMESSNSNSHNNISGINSNTSTNPNNRGLRTIINHTGTVYHVTKLWGIIDLGQHEHVFFDKSIFKHLDDLQRHFKCGESLYFNAILAPKQSRAKWRATQVWKETDNDLVQRFCNDLLVAPLAKATNDKKRLCKSNDQTKDCSCRNESDDFYYEEGFELDNNNCLYYDDDLDSCTTSVLSEQRQVMDNCRSIDEELAEIMKISKVQSSDDEDDDDDVNVNRNNRNNRNNITNNINTTTVTSIPTPNNPNNQSNSITSSPDESSTDCLSSSSGVPGEPTRLKHQYTTKYATIATQTISTGDIMSINVYHGPSDN